MKNLFYFFNITTLLNNDDLLEIIRNSLLYYIVLYCFFKTFTYLFKHERDFIASWVFDKYLRFTRV